MFDNFPTFNWLNRNENLGFHIPKHLAFKHGSTILEKIGLGHAGIKPLGNNITSFKHIRRHYICEGHDKRIYSKSLCDDDLEKQEEYVFCDREDYLGKISS